jgi:hypothetical protein
VSIVPGGPAASGEPVAPVSALDREEAVHRLRARYVDANTRRRQACGLAIDRARVVLVTPQDLVMVDELQGQRFDHLLVEQACLLDAASLCLAAAHIERSVVLAVDLDQHPPPPIADEPAPPWWLGASLLQLLGLADPEALAAHPASLAIG